MNVRYKWNVVSSILCHRKHVLQLTQQTNARLPRDVRIRVFAVVEEKKRLVALLSIFVCFYSILFFYFLFWRTYRRARCLRSTEGMLSRARLNT